MQRESATLGRDRKESLMDRSAGNVRLHSSGGILLFDPDLGSKLATRFGSDLSAVLDPEGKTTQTTEELRSRTRQVPKSNARLARFCTESGLMVLLVPPGEYSIEVRCGVLTPEERSRSVRSLDAWVAVTGKAL